MEDAPEEEWVSDAERFIAADVDDSGSLSVEELAVAAKVSIQKPKNFTKQQIQMETGRFLCQNLYPQRLPKNVLVTSTRCTSAKPIQSQQQQPVQPQQTRQQPNSPGVAGSTDGLAATNTTATSDAATTSHEHQPTIRSGFIVAAVGLDSIQTGGIVLCVEI